MVLQIHPFFRGINWANIHRYLAPFCAEPQNPEDMQHSDDDIPAEVGAFSFSFCSDKESIIMQPLARANGVL
jgi:hypothetical protein